MSATKRINRRRFISTAVASAGICTFNIRHSESQEKKRPNILFAIADDWSYPHASAYGEAGVRTPAFDRVARNGCLFTNTYAAAPQCSPNRASILTGRHIWQNEEAGTHASLFPKKLLVFTGLLEQSGYATGATGKMWGPGNWKDSGWERNPVGPAFTRRKNDAPTPRISNLDYAGNFEDFLTENDSEKPFFFWYGASEPHRMYLNGSALESGKSLDDVKVPAFLPDTPEVRSDILDYYLEIEWFDKHLGRMLDLLEERGELDNTIVVVTSDNGMPFPRAKANLYDYGVHMPLAVQWADGFKGNRKIEDVISFIDFAPTFLQAAGVETPDAMTGQSFLPILQSSQNGQVDPSRTTALFGRERHSHARFDNLGYPARGIRSKEFLYIRNMKPERYPAGDPPGYFDIDGGPSKSVIEDKDQYPKFHDLSVEKRPLEELFNVVDDPFCLTNLAGQDGMASVRETLWSTLESSLKTQGDPRVLGKGDVFDSYPRFNTMRPELGGFHEQGVYNPKYVSE